MKTQQKGQAIIELLVVVAAVLAVFWGLLWLQRWQQVKLQTQHHAALQAFVFSQSYELGAEEIEMVAPSYLMGLYSPVAHEQSTTVEALGVMPTPHRLLESARQEGVLGTTQRWRFQSQALASGMQLQSQISLWVGAGHANDDSQMVQRLAASTSLWRYAQDPSSTAIKALTPLIKPVDAAWGRAAPSSDWLSVWQESVPQPFLFGGQ